MKIIITGTPGTGKTKLALKLAREKNLDYYSLTDLLKKNKIYEEKTHHEILVDEEKTQAFLNNFFKEKNNFILDGFYSYLLKPENVSFCIVCKTPLKVLNERLQKRNYSEEKIKDNLEAEAFEHLLVEAQYQNHKIIEADTSKPFKDSLKELKDKIKI